MRLEELIHYYKPSIFTNTLPVMVMITLENSAGTTCNKGRRACSESERHMGGKAQKKGGKGEGQNVERPFNAPSYS